MPSNFDWSDKVVHPRAAVLVVALEVVAVPERQRLAVRVEHLVDLYVGRVDGNVGALLEADAVEHVRGVKHAIFKHVVQLKVGLDLRLVQIEFGLAHLFGVEVPVPWLKFETAVLSVDQRLNILASPCALAVAAGTSSSMNLTAASGVLGHLVGEPPGGVSE